MKNLRSWIAENVDKTWSWEGQIAYEMYRVRCCLERLEKKLEVTK